MDFFKRRIQAFLPVVKFHLLRFWRQWAAVLALTSLFFCSYYFFISPPANFPAGSIIVIAQGASTPLIAKELADAHLIASPHLFQIVLRASGRSDRIKTGAYRFQMPQNLFCIAYRIIAGDYGLPLVRMTFPEGTTVSEMAAQIAKAIPSVSADSFSRAGEPYEGYLFPDTYFFSSVTDAESLVKIMRANFNSKTASLSGEIKSSDHSFSDIVIMASLVEKETRTDADRHIVAGILWNRLGIGMPLQVDVARDTYEHKGFPSGPICNPGLDSLEASLNPTKTDYLYYLTGRDGLMHYATTFAGHQANLKKYLK